MESGAVGNPLLMPLTTTTLRSLSVELACEPESARRTRRALLQGGLDPDLDHTVSLLATELVANAVRHACDTTQIRVDAQLGDGYARVEVRDTGDGFDPEIRHETAGFGLRLVDKLATSWAVESERGGTCVWFEVDRRQRRFERVSGH